MGWVQDPQHPAASTLALPLCAGSSGSSPLCCPGLVRQCSTPTPQGPRTLFIFAREIKQLSAILFRGWTAVARLGPSFPSTSSTRLWAAAPLFGAPEGAGTPCAGLCPSSCAPDWRVPHHLMGTVPVWTCKGRVPSTHYALYTAGIWQCWREKRNPPEKCVSMAAVEAAQVDTVGIEGHSRQQSRLRDTLSREILQEESGNRSCGLINTRCVWRDSKIEQAAA